VALVVVEKAVDVSFFNVSLSLTNGAGFSLNGVNSSITDSSVQLLGCFGIAINGGDFASLSPGRNLVARNVISDFALFSRTYLPGISFNGVGNRYVGNTIRNGPHAAMVGGSAESVFENNFISTVCCEADDSGAWYSGRSWTRVGNVLRGNRFENIRLRVPGLVVPAIYLDDELSLHTVVNNSFVNCSVGVFIGGGRNNLVKGNHFLNSGSKAVHVDSRGLYSFSRCGPGGDFNRDLLSLNYKNPPYSTHFPQLVNVCK